MKTDNQRLVLMALALGERHGYDIIRDIMLRTEERFRLGPGSLFVSIQRMAEAGLIEESDERADPELNNELRRYYKLTPSGHRMVAT
jgi:DNA-binding PadR family transcriptional regulator